MFSPSRDQARTFLFDAWKKHKENAPLTDLERMTVAVILLHPEYHRELDNPAKYMEREYLPENGETNPFLHLSMHLALHEQLSIDQPRGIVARHRKMLEKTGDEHAAEHATLECLAEMIWQAQRYRTPPDAAIYLGCIDKKLGEENA